MKIVNSSSVALVPGQLVIAGLNCGMPLAPGVMVQYGLMPLFGITPLAINNSTFVASGRVFMSNISCRTVHGAFGAQ
jgi:hypothetical protein